MPTLLSIGNWGSQDQTGARATPHHHDWLLGSRPYSAPWNADGRFDVILGAAVLMEIYPVIWHVLLLNMHMFLALLLFTQ